MSKLYVLTYSHAHIEYITGQYTQQIQLQLQQSQQMYLQLLQQSQQMLQKATKGANFGSPSKKKRR